VTEATRELSDHVRDWLDRAAKRVVGRLGGGTVPAGACRGAVSAANSTSTATRLRGAWAAGRIREEVLANAPERKRETPHTAQARERDVDRIAERDSGLSNGR